MYFSVAFSCSCVFVCMCLCARAWACFSICFLSFWCTFALLHWKQLHANWYSSSVWMKIVQQKANKRKVNEKREINFIYSSLKFNWEPQIRIDSERTARTLPVEAERNTTGRQCSMETFIWFNWIWTHFIAPTLPQAKAVWRQTRLNLRFNLNVKLSGGYQITRQTQHPRRKQK